MCLQFSSQVLLMDNISPPFRTLKGIGALHDASLKMSINVTIAHTKW